MGEDVNFVVTSQLARRDLRVHVTFSSHCFSHAYDRNTHPSDQPILDVASTKPRTFCPIRYRLSHQLPTLIQGLNHPKMKVWETSAERNWCYSVTTEDPSGPYHVFFEVRRASKERRQWQDLNLVVESAYHQDEGAAPRLNGSMAFVLLCGKVYVGERTTTKR